MHTSIEELQEHLPDFSMHCAVQWKEDSLRPLNARVSSAGLAWSADWDLPLRTTSSEYTDSIENTTGQRSAGPASIVILVTLRKLAALLGAGGDAGRTAGHADPRSTAVQQYSIHS